MQEVEKRYLAHRRGYPRRKRYRGHLQQKTYNWDRNYSTEDDAEDENGKFSDDEIDIDTEESEEDLDIEENVTETGILKRHYSSIRDINRHNSNSDKSQKLDRNYGSIFNEVNTLRPSLSIGQESIPIGFFAIETTTTEESVGNRRWDSNSQSFQNIMASNRRNESDNKNPTFNDNNFSDDAFKSTDFFKIMNASLAINRRIESKRNGKEKAVFDVPRPQRFRRLYTKWSKWSKCSAKCTTRRFKRCKAKDICGNAVQREVLYCYTEGSFCQTWIDNQNSPIIVNQKPSDFGLHSNIARPWSANVITNELSTFGRSYRAPEYQPQNIKCGFAMVRQKPKNYLWGMLRIIGGKTARKGQWPWQVAILNKFKVKWFI